MNLTPFYIESFLKGSCPGIILISQRYSNIKITRKAILDSNEDLKDLSILMETYPNEE